MKHLQDNISYILGAVSFSTYISDWMSAIPDLQTSVLLLTAVWLTVQIILKIWEFIRTFYSD